MDSLTSGDVMTVLYSIVGISVSVWATLVAMALLFGRRAAAAQERFQEAPWRSLVLGLVISLPAGLVAVTFLGNPNPLAKLVGWALLSYLLAISAVGGGGLALLVGERIGRMEPGISRFSALARGAGLIVVMGLVPLFGWFAYVPLVIVIAIGAGGQAIFSRPRLHAVANGATVEVRG